MYEVDALDHICGKVDALFKKFDKQNVNVVSLNITHWEIYRVISHSDIDCKLISNGESSFHHVNYINIPYRRNPYSNTYNPWWRCHPYFLTKTPIPNKYLDLLVFKDKRVLTL